MSNKSRRCCSAGTQAPHRCGPVPRQLYLPGLRQAEQLQQLLGVLAGLHTGLCGGNSCRGGRRLLVHAQESTFPGSSLDGAVLTANAPAGPNGWSTIDRLCRCMPKYHAWLHLDMVFGGVAASGSCCHRDRFARWVWEFGSFLTLPWLQLLST